MTIVKSLWIVLACMLGGKAVLAEPIVVVVDDIGDTNSLFSRQISAELNSMGFIPKVVQPTGDAWNPEALEEVAVTHGAIAAITLRSGTGGPVVWIADRTTGKLLRREVRADDEAGAQVQAVRAVELLRASLLELEATHSPPAKVPVPQTARIVASESLRLTDERGRLTIGLSSGGIFSPGGLSPSAMGLLDLGFVPGRWMGVSGVLIFPITSAQTTNDAGSLNLWFAMAGLAMKVSFLTQTNPWQLDTHVGVGSQFTIAKGTPNDGFGGRSIVARSVVPFIRVGVSRRLVRHWYVRLNVMAAVALPKLVLRTDEMRTAEYGFPWFGVTLGMVVTW